MAKSKSSSKTEDLHSGLKIVFAVLFIALPLIAFMLGMQYQKVASEAYAEDEIVESGYVR